jgi:hypothetical protein
MSEIVTKYVNELVEIICKEYGSSDPEQEQALRDDFTAKLTDSFTKFEKEVISSNDMPLNDMLSIVNKVGTKTGKKGGNGWNLFNKKFTKANGWTKEQTQMEWAALTDEQKAYYNGEAKKVRDSIANSTNKSDIVHTTSSSTGNRSEIWHGFQKYFTYTCKQKGSKYSPSECSAAYKLMSDSEKEKYRGWVPPQ